MKRVMGSGLVVAAFVCLLSVNAAAEGDRLGWFKEAKFGMFIHWGPYSQLGVEASWPLVNHQVPVEKYEALAQTFNPTKFDARKVARLAKEAGMKYVVVTSKHHDGYAMYDTKLSDYSVMHSPIKRDLAKELADAVRAEGLRFGFYYSLCDWHHPDYRHRSVPFPEKYPGRWPTTPTWQKFIDFYQGQVRELLTRYGPISIMWFDGAWEHTAEEWQTEKLVKMIHSIQPDCVINDRCGDPKLGDYGTPEQFVPEKALERPWETCMTINEQWGYKHDATQWKSAKQLVQTLADIAGKGGNFLLNIGPMPTGEVQPEFVERLQAMGEWLKKNGESIYGTQGAPPGLTAPGPVTQKPGVLYFHIFDVPDDDIVIKGIEKPVVSVKILSTGGDLQFSQKDGEVRFRIPKAASDPSDTVIRVAISEQRKSAEGAPPTFASNPGTISGVKMFL